MAIAGEVTIRMRIVIEQPVAGVMHSLQQDNKPLDAKVLDARRSDDAESLSFEFPLRLAPGLRSDRPRFLGAFVRREGKHRRFVYIRVGQSAGQCFSPWSRRMKIDIHDIDPALLEKAKSGAVLEGTINGTGKDGTPACATVRPVVWRAA